MQPSLLQKALKKLHTCACKPTTTHNDKLEILSVIKRTVPEYEDWSNPLGDWAKIPPVDISKEDISTIPFKTDLPPTIFNVAVPTRKGKSIAHNGIVDGSASTGIQGENPKYKLDLTEAAEDVCPQCLDTGKAERLNIEEETVTEVDCPNCITGYQSDIDECDSCLGTGTISGTPIDCPVCFGTGEIDYTYFKKDLDSEQYKHVNAKTMLIAEECTECKGITGNSKCKTCRGKGYTTRKDTKTIQLKYKPVTNDKGTNCSSTDTTGEGK